MSLIIVLPNSPEFTLTTGPVLPRASATVFEFKTIPNTPSGQPVNVTVYLDPSPVTEPTWQPTALPEANQKSSVVRPVTFSSNWTVKLLTSLVNVVLSKLIFTSGATASTTTGTELTSKTVATNVPLNFSVGSSVVTLKK